MLVPVMILKIFFHCPLKVLSSKMDLVESSRIR